MGFLCVVSMASAWPSILISLGAVIPSQRDSAARTALRLRRLEKPTRIERELALLERATDAHVRLVRQVDGPARTPQLVVAIEKHEHFRLEALRNVFADDDAVLAGGELDGAADRKGAHATDELLEERPMECGA